MEATILPYPSLPQIMKVLVFLENPLYLYSEVIICFVNESVF